MTETMNEWYVQIAESALQQSRKGRRILELARQPKLGTTPFPFKRYSNCWGTSVHIHRKERELRKALYEKHQSLNGIGFPLDYARPGFVDLDPMILFLERLTDAGRENPFEIIAFSWTEEEEIRGETVDVFELRHSATYLGEIRGHYLMFHQTCRGDLGGTFEITEINEWLQSGFEYYDDSIEFRVVI